MNRILVAALVAAFAAGCASMGIGGGPSAVADLEPTKGNSTKGAVTFAQTGDKVRVHAQVSGLKARLRAWVHTSTRRATAARATA